MKWPTVQLRCVTSKVGSGATPRGGEEVYQSSGIPLIRSMNVHFDGFRRKGLVFINSEEAIQLDHVAVQAGDVLFNITGASIGRVTTAPTDMAGARVNQHVCILRTTDVLLPRFLAYYMATPTQQAVVNSNQVGGTRQAVTKAMLLNWPVPLPVLKEQRRIVELLEQADGLRRQRAEADALAERILPALFQKMFGNPATNPKGWLVKRVEEITSGGRRGITTGPFGTQLGTEDFTSEGPEVFGIYSIDKMNTFRSGGPKHISEAKLAELGRFTVQTGDVLLSRMGTLGRVCVVPDDAPPGIVSYHLIRVRLNRRVCDPIFFSLLLAAAEYTGCGLSSHGKGAIMSGINAAIVANFRLMVPTIEAQRAFSLLALPINSLRDRRRAAVDSLERLFAVMLHRAFTGELTAKWREAHLKELLAEMEHQARLLARRPVE